jgi:hypothetical protein
VISSGRMVRSDISVPSWLVALAVRATGVGRLVDWRRRAGPPSGTAEPTG